MKTSHKVVAVLVPLAVIAGCIIVVIVVAKIRSNNKEHFRKCICSSREGGRQDNCQDTVTVNNKYVTNELTEFSDLPSPGWDRGASPGDVDFPVSEGCGFGQEPHDKQGWPMWDFTDFGS